MQRLHQLLDSAVMFIDNGDKATVITSEEMNDTKGKPSLIIAGVWKDFDMFGDTVNLVKSVYPFDDISDRISKAAENERFVVTDKNKGQDILVRSIGIQPAKGTIILNLAKGSISQENGAVKSENPEGAKFQQRATITPDMSDSEREAYQLGAAQRAEDAAKSRAAEQKRTRSAPMAKKGGSVIFESVKGEYHTGSAKGEQIAFLRRLAQVMKKDIHLYESTVENGVRTATVRGATVSANGFFLSENGEIWVDINSGAGGEGHGGHRRQDVRCRSFGGDRQTDPRGRLARSFGRRRDRQQQGRCIRFKRGKDSGRAYRADAEPEPCVS